MAICSHLAPNGEKSILYQSLEQKYGPEMAHDTWERIRSQQFINKYGDWKSKNYSLFHQYMDLQIVKEKLVNGGYSFYASQEDADNNKETKVTPENVDLAIQMDNKYGEMVFRKGRIDFPETGGMLGSTEFEDFGDLERGARGQISELTPDEVGEFKNRYDELLAKYQSGFKEIPFDINGEPVLNWVEEKLNIPQSKLNIWYASDENSRFSNLAPRPFTYEGIQYHSVEHAYQSLKSGEFDQSTYNKYKKAGVKIPGGRGTKTDNGYNIRLMESLVLTSFQQNPKELEALKATGTVQITHTQDKGIWATEFPRILMKIREEVVPAQTNTPQTEEVLVDLEQKLPKAKLSETDILNRIKVIYDRATSEPDKTFRFTYEHTSDRAKLGKTQYTSRELANLFDSLPIPLNVQFTPSMQALIDNSSRRIVEQFKNDIPVEFIARNDERIIQTAAELLIPKVNSEGKPDGFFTPAEQKEILDSIVSYTERLYRQKPALKANALIKAFGLFKAKEQILLGRGEKEKGAIFTSIYNHRVRLAEEALRQLEALGLRTDTGTMYRILEAVNQLTPMTEQEKIEFREANPNIDPEMLDPYTGEFLESVGRIARDWSDNTFELDPKDTASARIKLFMGTMYEMDKGVYTIDPKGEAISDLPSDLTTMLLPEQLALAKRLSRKPFWYKDEKSSTELKQWLDTNYPHFARENFLGIGKTADYDTIFQETLNTLGNKLQGQTFEQTMLLLDAHHDPTIRQMAQELRKADQSMKNEFMMVMSKQYQPFTMALFNTARDLNGREYYVLNPIKSNRYGQRETLIKYWQQQQKLSEITITSPTGQRVLDVKRIQERWLPLLETAKVVNDWTTPQARGWFVKNMGNILRISGIGVTDEMMQDLYENPRKWTTSDSVLGMFSINKTTGQPAGLFSIFIMKSAGQMIAGENTDIEGATELSQLNNPLHTENTLMQGLARLVSKYTPVLYSSNHRNSEGKSVYDWGLNTKLSHQVRQMVEDFPTFLATAQKVDIARNSWLLDALQETPGQIEHIELSYLDGLKPSWGNRGTNRASMSDREQLLTSVLLFQNRGHGFNKNGGKVNYMSLTHGDKTMTPVFRNMPKVNTGRYQFLPNTVVGRPDSALFKVFKSEYDRITRQADQTYNSKQYDAGKHLFYFLPDFNYDAMTRMVQDGRLTQTEFNAIWPAGQRKLTSIIDSNELSVINKILTNFTNNLVMNTLNKWQENGIVKKDGNIFDKQYVQKLMIENGIRETVRESRRVNELATKFVDATGNELSIEDVNKQIAGTAAKDYAINSFLFNTAMSQLFYGDPAENFKKAKGSADDMAHVESTMIEYTKRLAKDIAPRADLYWEKGKEKYNAITLADVKTRETYLAAIKALKEAYADNTTDSTDAQEFTTVQEKLDVLFASGKISSLHYNEMSDIIRRAGPGGYYEFINPDHLNIIMQPDKPIYAGFRAPERGVRLTDYVKSSSYALYPPLTKGREIDKLRALMEKNGVARANFESAKKLGSPARSLTVFSSDGLYQEPQEDEVTAATQQLDRSGFGIQQDVPYDEDKEEIKTITQMNEGITEGIGSIKGFKIPGVEEEMAGRALKKYKEQIRKEMLQHNLNDFLKSLNVDEDGNIDPEKVMTLLAAEARKKGYTLNELQSVLVRDEDGMPVVSTMFNTAADKFEGLLMSMVNKIATVKMPGKSYVQASSTGLRIDTSDDADLSKIIWVGDYDGKPLKGLRKEDGKIKPGQVILPFNFFDHQGNKLKVENFLINNNGKKSLDMARIPQELLELVGARIPNQKHSSMHPLEVVGFTPSNMGDTIFIPAVLVKQMGGDFDVDKLYTYKRPYNYDPETASFSPVAHSSDKVRSMEQLQKDYFEVHWAILNHPDMLETILKPLDIDDLKSESQLLRKPVGQYYNFYDPMTQLEDFQRGKEAKRLVGTSSWAVKLNARLQDKKLQYGKLEIVTEEDGTQKAQTTPATIRVTDEHNFVPRDLTLLSGTGVSKFSKKDSDYHNAEKRTKGDNHVLVQSEAVDNTKNRILDPLNLTPDTYKAVQALIQLETEDGWAPNSKYWTRLITQPIIWEYSRMMKQGNDSLSEKYDPILHTNVLSTLATKYAEMLSPEGRTQFINDEIGHNIVFDPQLLLKAQTMKGDEFALHQIAALNLFAELHTIGQRMFELESQFNQDVSGAGPNLFTALNKTEQLKGIDQLPIMNSSQLYMNEKGVLTEIGATFDMTNGTAVDIVKQVFPYHALKPLLGKLKAFTNKKEMSVDQQRDILRGFRSFVYTSGPHWWADAQGERVRLIYGKDSLARRMVNAQKTWGQDNPFLSRLKSRIGDNSADPDFIEYVASSQTSVTDKQNMTNGWLYMLMSEDEEQRHMGEDLLRYAYLTSGIQDANSFVQFVPVAYLAGTEFSRMLRGMEQTLKDDGEYENDGFLIQYLQHNPVLATQVTPEQFGQLAPGREYPESFMVPTRDSKEFARFNNLVGADRDMLPFVSYRSKTDGKWILYMRNQVGETTFYTRIDTLGNQFSDEYNGLVPAGQRSIFSQNRSLAENIPALSLDGITEIKKHKQNEFGLGSFNKLTSNFQQIGIQQGGSEEAINALTSIKNNTRIPEYLRVVSDMLLTSKDTMTDDPIKELTGGMGPFKIILDVKSSNKAGFDNVVTLNSLLVQSNNDAAETFLHELLHNRLMWMVAGAGLDERVSTILKTEEERAYYDKHVAAFKKRHPAIIDSLNKLDRIRYEALSAYRSTLAEVDFQRIQKEVEDGVNNGPEHTMIYALSSLQEFVAYTPTNGQVAAFLNSQTSVRGETILSKVLNIFTQLLEALAKSFGFKVKNDSLLREALLHILKLTTFDNNHDLDITTTLTDPDAVIKVDNQATAEEIQSLLRDTYNREGKLESDETGWRLLDNEHRKVHAVEGQRGRILDKLYEQSDNVADALNRTHDLAQRTALRSKYRDIRESIKQIHQENNIDVIAKIGRAQLKWVDEVLRNPRPTTIDVNLALQTTNIWESLVNILYGSLKQVGDINKDFIDVQSEAQRRRIELCNSKAIDVLTETMKHDIKLTPLDFKNKLVDIDAISANTLALVRAKPAMVQGTAVLGWREANNRDEAIFRNTKRLAALDKKLKAAGLTPNMMLQMGDDGKGWGLVNRLSNTWNVKIKTDRNNLEATINALDKTQNLDPKQRTDRKREAWNKYWTELKKENTFADARIFYDVKTGARRTGTEVDKAFDKLAEEVGSRTYAEELVAKGQQKYQDYLSEREAMNDYLDTTLQLTEDEKKDKTIAEQNQLLTTLKTDAMAKWLTYNSPIDLLNKLDSNQHVEFNSDGDAWLEMGPRKEFKQYFDDRFEKIESDEQMKEAYGEYKNILTEMISYLPVEIQREIPNNFFPIVPKDTASWLATVLGKIKNWDQELLNALTATDAEAASRLRPDKIPVMYTYPTNVTKDIGDRSTDLTRVLELFSMMALQHKYMGKVLDTINVAENVLKEVNRQRLNGESEGKPLRHIMDALKYFKDNLVFRKPKELQGKVDSPIYSMNPAKQHKITIEIKELTTEKEKLQEQVSNKMIEGDFDTEVEDKRIEAIDKQLTNYELMARNIYGSKFADGLISINQMKSLGFNPFSAVSNYTFAEISLSIHGRGRVDYDPKTLGEAMGVMSHAMKRYWSFGTVTDPVASKIHGLMARTGIMGDVVDTDYGQSPGKRKTRTGRVLDPFNWQRSGDYFTKGKLMVAMFKKMTVEVTDQVTREVKTIPLWDAFDRDGEWDIAKYGVNPDWDTREGKGTKFNQLRDRMRKVSVMVFGNQDKNAPLMAKKNWLWRLAGQFRLSWFPEGIATRFKPEYDDANLGRKVKGRWRTYSDLGFLTSSLVLSRQMLGALPGIKKDPFVGIQDRKGRLLSESPVDMENMRKNFAGLAWTAGFTATILILRGLGGDDKDKDKNHRQLLINMLIRNQQDLLLYSSPAVFNTISGNLLPATQVIVDYWNAVTGTAHYLFGDTSKDRHAFQSWIKKITRAGLPHPSASLYNKFETMINRDLDKIRR